MGGGLEYNGDEISPLDDRELRTCVKAMLANKPPVKNVVISAVFAPRDSPTEGQELRAARIVQAACPDISCTLSHQVCVCVLLCMSLSLVSLEASLQMR